MAKKGGKGRPTKYDWAKLKQDFIEAKLADPNYSLNDFAYDVGIEGSWLRGQASRNDWLADYQNRRTKLDDILLNEAMERHGAVMDKLRRKLVFTEEHLRARAATFAGTIKGRIEESLLSIDWTNVSMKERREMYSLMHEIESSALGITPAKHTVHHHVSHQAKGPDGKIYLSADHAEETHQRRLMIAEKFFSVIEGESSRVLNNVRSLPKKKEAA